MSLTKYLAPVLLALCLTASADVTNYSTTPANNNGSPPNGAPEGMAPGAVNDTIRQIMADIALEAQRNRVKVLNSVSGTNTITGVLAPSLTAYSTGMLVVFTPAGANTGATTLNVNSLGARSIVKRNGTALIANDLVAGIPALVVTSGTQFVLLNPLTDMSAAQVLAALLTVDGAGSGLDADLLDGQHAAAFAAASHNHSASDVTSGILPTTRGGTGTTATTGSLGAVVFSISPTLSGTITGGTFSGSHSGNGSALTSLNASNLSSGTVADARISSSSVTQHMDDGYARNITGKVGTTKNLVPNASCPPSVSGEDGRITYCY